MLDSKEAKAIVAAILAAGLVDRLPVLGGNEDNRIDGVVNVWLKFYNHIDLRWPKAREGTSA